MFIIPVLASSSISSVWFVDVFFVIDMSSGLTTTLYMIFCYKIYYDFFMTCKLYVKFVLMHLSIFSCVKMIFDIYLLTYLTMFFICPDGYSSTNAFCLQFLNHFSLHDVASVIVPLVHIVSVVVSVSVTVPDDAVHNTVDFVFYICVWCLYSHIAVIFYHKLYITIFLYHIYLSYVFLYLDIVFTYLLIFFHLSIWIFCHTYIFCKIFQ